jgi:hypothetical protein
LKQLDEQYTKWVGPERVPDHYTLSANGRSGIAEKATYLRLLSQPDQDWIANDGDRLAAAAAADAALAALAKLTGEPAPPKPTTTGKTRWLQKEHDPILETYLQGKFLPKATLKKRAVEIGRDMGMDPAQVKTAHARLEKKAKLPAVEPTTASPPPVADAPTTTPPPPISDDDDSPDDFEDAMLAIAPKTRKEKEPRRKRQAKKR